MKEPELPARPVYGWDAAAKILGRTVNGCRVAQSQGRLKLKIVKLGNRAVFDHDELLAVKYAAKGVRN